MQPVDPEPKRQAAPRSPRGFRVAVAARTVLVTASLVAAFYLLPMDRPFSARTVLGLVAGLAAVALLLGWQVRLIARSPHPRWQALEAFAMTVPLFLLLFATGYFLMERQAADSFNEPLTRTDTLYFTITVFSTVGFGDIVPRSEPARLLAMVQMAADLVLLGAAARLVIDAVREGMDLQAHSQDQSRAAQPPPRSGQ